MWLGKDVGSLESDICLRNVKAPLHVLIHLIFSSMVMLYVPVYR